jgi:PAS domain S-box-containing protein
MSHRSDQRSFSSAAGHSKQLEPSVEANLRRKVTSGFIIALFLTAFIGFLSWRSARLAADDADWVTHTYAVMDALELMATDVIEVETSSRTFVLTGQDSSLTQYNTARGAVVPDEGVLRHLTVDNPDQQRRLDTLEPQIHALLEFAREIVAERSRRQAPPNPSQIIETDGLFNAVRAKVQEIKAEEMRLLSQRTQRAKAGTRWISFIVVVGGLAGVGWLVLARITVNREIEVSERGRAELKALNVTLEQRVKQRTAGLQSEINERKQSKQELAEQAEELARSRQDLETKTRMLQSVLDGIAEGLVATDEKLNFILWNPAAEKMLGLKASDLASDKWSAHYGLYLTDTVTPFPSDQIPLVRAIRGEVSTTEMFVRNPELIEGKWIEVSAGPIRDKHGAVCGGVAAFRDITRSRADERQIRELNEELEHRVIERTAQLETANKELEAFSYSVSHDLRAPLRHISGFSKLLMEDFAPTLDPVARDYLERIHAGTQKMGLLVDELLNLARVGRHALNRQPTKLNLIVAEVIEILRPESEGRHSDWVVGDLPAIECDPVLIRQVFQNLLANALKFTGPRGGADGGSPAATAASSRRTVIEVSHKEEGGQQVFMVRDNGVGFSMKYVDKLFGVFQRLHTENEFEGTGIGLVTVQRIVHKHGGRVWAEGEIDKGASFFFTLGAGKQVESKASHATAGGQL